MEVYGFSIMLAAGGVLVGFFYATLFVRLLGALGSAIAGNQTIANSNNKFLATIGFVLCVAGQVLGMAIWFAFILGLATVIRATYPKEGASTVWVCAAIALLAPCLFLATDSLQTTREEIGTTQTSSMGLTLLLSLVALGAFATDPSYINDYFKWTQVKEVFKGFK